MHSGITRVLVPAAIFALVSCEGPSSVSPRTESSTVDARARRLSRSVKAWLPEIHRQYRARVRG